MSNRVMARVCALIFYFFNFFVLLDWDAWSTIMVSHIKMKALSSLSSGDFLWDAIVWQKDAPVCNIICSSDAISAVSYGL